MHKLTQLLKSDMTPALGVTEPGAIAFAVSKAKTFLTKEEAELKNIHVKMNSGMYKNAFTCGIPNSDHVGNVFSAALGYVAGESEKGLLSLEDVNENDNKEAEKLVDEGKVTVEMSGISSVIFIEATITTSEEEVIVTISDSHTNVTKVELNGETIFDKETKKEDSEIDQTEESEVPHEIHNYTLKDLYEYADTVPLEEIEFIEEAYRVNMDLFEESIKSDRTTFAHALLNANGGEVFSENVQKTANLLCNATIEGRVIGLNKPAMSITGSGAHGIIATMPLYAVYKIKNYSKEKLLRATALSYLVCTYIKEYSGRLSAFCGCAIAAGSGMACALVYLADGSVDDMTRTLNNMASSITGMICDGGNHGCTMKGIAAVATAFQSAEFAINGVSISSEHGINGSTPEETMKNMGLIASPGMVKTEKTIVDIFQEKLAQKSK